jgi:hypothetical protein
MASETVLPVVSPAQPSHRSHRGDSLPSLLELVERYIPSARPLISVAEVRALPPVEEDEEKGGRS